MFPFVRFVTCAAMFSSNNRGAKTLMEKRIRRMMPLLDERQKRLYLANEAIPYGRGGISLVSRIFRHITDHYNKNSQRTEQQR
jgi:hypothetical protein